MYVLSTQKLKCLEIVKAFILQCGNKTTGVLANVLVNFNIEIHNKNLSIRTETMLSNVRTGLCKH